MFSITKLFSTFFLTRGIFTKLDIQSRNVSVQIFRNLIYVLSCLFFSKPDMSRLRLAAGSAIVKLAQEPCYHEIITLEQYQLCALAINVRKMTRLDVTLNGLFDF